MPKNPLPPNSLPLDANAPGYPPVDHSTKSASSDLDDILNAALDDLEDDDLGKDTHAREDKRHEDLNDQKSQSAMSSLLSSMNDPVYGDSLRSSLGALSGTQEGVDTIDSYINTQFKDNTTKEGTDVDRTVNKLLNDMGKAGAQFEGVEADKIETMGEDIMNNMMGEFEKMGEKDDYNEVIDGMMRQLLSRELMYDPMKQVCKKFPQWLAENKAQLTDEDYQRYGTQYQYFQRIVAVYETEPDNYPRLMELMNDIQEYGQPPSAIVKELAPGLEFNESGMPVMPNMGNSMMPEGMKMPGSEENCCIM